MKIKILNLIRKGVNILAGISFVFIIISEPFIGFVAFFLMLFFITVAARLTITIDELKKAEQEISGMGMEERNKKNADE